MPLDVNGYNSAMFQSFVDFAKISEGMGKENAVARVNTGVDVSNGVLAGRNVTAATTDSVRSIFKWFRSADDKVANDETRKIFRDTIANMFGGDSMIPASVKDAMRLVDYDKGKPLTARRILVVKAAIDGIKQNIGDALKTAQKNASSILANVPAERKAEVGPLVEMAIQRCGGDKDALDVVSETIDRILLREDAKLRTTEAVAKKVDGIITNIREMREAAQGKQAVLAACKDFLLLMGGKSLPPGHLPALMRMVATTDTSSVVRLKGGASGIEIDHAVGNLGKIAKELMVKSGVDKVTDGADEKESVRDLIVNLVIAKIGPSDARKLLKALSTDTAQKLRTVYGMLGQEEFDTAGMSRGMVEFTSLQGNLGIKFLFFMKNTAEATLGLERSTVDPYDGSFDLTDFGGSQIFERAKVDAREMMEQRREELISKFVDGNGPGAEEMRALFARKIGPEPSDYEMGETNKRDNVAKQMSNWTIAAECKKCMAGDFQNTAFARDVVQGLNVTFPDGTKLAGDFETARDQIASFVTGGATAKYDDLDDVGKGKANIVMALLSQEMARASYDSHAISLDPKLRKPQYTTTVSDPASEKQEFKLAFNDKGELSVAFIGEKRISTLSANVPQTNAGGQTDVAAKTVATNPGSTLGTKFTLFISSDEFNRLASLDYSNFDDTEAREIANDENQIDTFSKVVKSFDKGFRFTPGTGNVRVFTEFNANFN